MSSGPAINRVLRKLAPERTLRRAVLQTIRERVRRLVRGALETAVVQIAARWLPVVSRAPSKHLRHWYAQNAPSPQQLQEQRERPWPAHAPWISLLVPVRGLRGAQATWQALEQQTYPFWEIVFVVEAKQADRLRRRVGAANNRVRIQEASPGGDGASGLEDARQLASGDYIGVMSAGDTLSPHALAELANHLLRHPETDVLYCDEDCLASLGRRHGLRLKPDWSPEMLLGFNYFGRLCLIRNGVLRAAGGFDARFAGAQEYEALLRVTEKTARVGRVPQCLYHRRAGLSSRLDWTLGQGAVPDRERALREHLLRLGHDAVVTTLPNGLHRARWPVAEPPLVSIIIPTFNQPEILRQCVEGLRRRTDYPRREIILVDNASTDARVHEYYRELTAARAATIVPFDREFNYSAACNLGARRAAGELLLFLNNDISVIDPGWLDELVRFALRPGVGCVGTKLLYPNGLVQHAGVVAGMHDLYGLLYNKAEDGHWDEFGSPDMYRNLLGIMGACQLVPRRAFDAAGGFDERYRIANSDIALCLRLHKRGLRTVYTPHAALVHHEGYTRGKVNPLEDIELSSLDIQDLRIAEDPYFHPAFSPRHAIPALRLQPDVSAREFLKTQVELLTRTPAADAAIDLFADDKVRGIPGAAAGLPKWSAHDAVGSEWDAARLALYLLRKSPALRQGFPRALSAGMNGPYCQWLCEEAVSRFGLAATATAHIRNAFRRDPGARVRGLYAARWEAPLVRDDLTPTAGRAGFFQWLVSHGEALHGLRDEEIWWFLVQSAEDPIAELVHEYSTAPVLQTGFPEAMTDIGWPRFYRWAQPRYYPHADPLELTEFQSPLSPLEQLRVLYDHRPGWRLQVPDAFRDAKSLRRLVAWLGEPSHWPAGEFDPVWVKRVHDAVTNGAGPVHGINILGHFSYPSGLRTSVESVVKSLRLLNVPLTRHDARVPGADLAHGRSTDLHEIHDVTLIHVQPGPYFESAYRLANLRRERDRYRIAMWYWEFGEIPAEWKKQARAIDELWAPTRFIADALQRSIDRPVVPMLPGVEVGPVAALPRSRFGIPDDKVLFLFMYDMMSIQERKNPLGVIEAFRRAFRRDDRAHLAIKISHSRGYREEYLKLLTAARDAGVQIIDATLPRNEAYGLMQCCDCYVSLHRSEGLGLTMAEAMLMGKPVIATAYSGNLDFMTADDSLPVGYDLVPVERDYPPYKQGWLWAEPSIEEAAHWMRWVCRRRDDALALGQRAREATERTLSMRAAGERMVRRLEEIERLRRGRRTSAARRDFPFPGEVLPARKGQLALPRSGLGGMANLAPCAEVGA